MIPLTSNTEARDWIARARPWASLDEDERLAAEDALDRELEERVHAARYEATQ